MVFPLGRVARAEQICPPVRGRPTRAGAAEFEGMRRLRIKEPQLHESQGLKFKGDCDDGRSQRTHVQMILSGLVGFGELKI